MSWFDVRVLQMAGRARSRSTQEEIRRTTEFSNATDLTIVPGADIDEGARKQAVKETAAKLYGQGFSRPKIARILRKHLITELMRTRPMEQQLTAARARLKAWEKQDDFRDLVYNLAIVKLDLATPQIIAGVTKQAKRGRVDAARLALELTGRHNPKGDDKPTQVMVQINGVPRPARITGGRTAEVTLEGTEYDELDP